MQRDVDIHQIWDGRFYRSGDLVKADTGGCSGCSGCCRGMGTSVVLDPYDIWRFQTQLGLVFERLLHGFAELNMQDGLAVPNLCMNGEGAGCVFLDEQDRCKIHPARPGFCRLFPLGRYYEGTEGDFQYFLQIHQCDHVRTKVRVRKWLDQPDLPLYEEYIRHWHAFWVQAREAADADPSGERRRSISLMILKTFYLPVWDESRPFYEQFEDRLAQAREALNALTADASPESPDEAGT